MLNLADRIRWWLTMAVLAVAIPVVLPAAQVRADVTSYDLLQVQQTNRCLDVPSRFPWEGFGNGDRLQVWSCNGNNQQEWRMQYVKSSGFTMLWRIQVRRSGKCLEIDARFIHNNGSLAQQWDCWNGDNQLWYFGVSNARGWHQLINFASRKCLDVDIASGGIWDGTQVQQWDCNGGPTANQEWRHS